jgi:hypothetical protein
MVGFERFEVVEVADGFDPRGQGELLGYDISSGYNDSLLWWGLQPQPGINVLPGPIRELADLLHRHYAPLLSQYGLFKSAETADQCLRSMDALQRLSPNLFEGVDLRPGYQVVSVSLLSTNGSAAPQETRVAKIDGDYKGGGSDVKH